MGTARLLARRRSAGSQPVVSPVANRRTIERRLHPDAEPRGGVGRQRDTRLSLPTRVNVRDTIASFRKSRMNKFHHTLIFLAAFLAVFWEAAFGGIRNVLGAQVSLLPGLMVYAAMSAGLLTLALLALFGGLLFDSLSANPLGVSVLPLFVVGVMIHARRDLLLREQVFAQIVLGVLASALAPALAVLVLLTLGESPLLGWGSLWQWLVMSAGGAAATPLLFILFGWLNRVLGYQPAMEASFRPDREIRRGRS
jgi:cell shape-determining protein MreD